MARINLLPWRQEERERKNKEFITLVFAVALLSLLAVFAAWKFFDSQLNEQQRANDLIVQENARLDGVLTEIEDLEQRREDIISRMRVIQDLQGRRPVPVRIWDDISRAIPPAMYITNFKREGDLLTLTGLADNPNVVSSLIRNLDASNWMGNSAVRNIQQNIRAYQAAPTVDATVSGVQTYPENRYVQFVVTTQVQSAAEAPEAEQSATANADGGQS